MSFATLEEAWGVRSLVPPPPAADVADPPLPPSRRLRASRGRPLRPHAAAVVDPDDDPDAQAVRRVLARAYEQYGPQGVARLLPPGAMLDIASVGGGPGGRRGRRGCWRRWLARKLKKPETLLLVLLCAFALFVAWDATAARAAATAVPSLASLHMTPFSLGGSA